MDKFLKGLNSSQQAAVRTVDGPLLILAGPGSGKTRVITHRIAHMVLHGVPARSILALTFTNKAAQEMRSRVEQLVPGHYVRMGTFHSFAARLMREYAPHVGLQENYTIYDMDDAKRALKGVVERRKLNLQHITVPAIQAGISWAKNKLITPEKYEPTPGSLLGSVVAKVYPEYQQTLLRSNAVDFDDLLMHLANILRDCPEVRTGLDSRFRYIMVDEYQDTNLAQYAIARSLSIDYPNLAVTGDPDQSIYGWRGANIRNILDFENDYPDVKVVRLEQNYRSTKNILHIASTLIKHNKQRKDKELYTDNEPGPAVRLAHYSNNYEEADDIAQQISHAVKSGKRTCGDFAIFYRTNAMSRNLEHALRKEAIPLQLVHALEFYQRKEIRDVRAYLQLLNNPMDDAAMQRVVNVPRRGIGKTTIGRLAMFGDRFGLPMLEAARNCDQIETLTKRSRTPLGKFVEAYDRIMNAGATNVFELLTVVLKESGYREMLEKSELPEDKDRLENIDELLTVAKEFDDRYEGDRPLEDFLEETALAGDVDSFEQDQERVTLMTLHASKGLEFSCVYVVAVEEGLLPHERSTDSADQIEEERRLLFVGMTRAEQELQVSKAEYRMFRGKNTMTVPSRFLMELPRAEMDIIGNGYSLELEEPDDQFTVNGEHEDGFSDTKFADELAEDFDAGSDDQADLIDMSETNEADAGSDYDDEQNNRRAYANRQCGLAPPAPASTSDCDDLFHDEPVCDDVIDFTSNDCPDDTSDDLFGNPWDDTSSSSPQPPARKIRLTTAAELHADDDDRSDNGNSGNDGDSDRIEFAGAYDPDMYEVGTGIVHPTYGPGKIAELSGSGAKRKAVIDFPMHGQKKIILAESKIRPIRG